MKRNKFGIHVSNKRHRDFDALLNMGVHNYTILHDQVDRARQIRERYPTALMLCRFYQPRWSDLTPVAWAGLTARLYQHDWKEITHHVTPANEMNLPNEGGGWEPDDYRRINEWLLEYAVAFREYHPEAILHWPALAQGHYEDGRHEDGHDLAWSGYGICRESLDAYDVVDVHTYWRPGGAGLFEADPLSRWLAWRFPHDRDRFYPVKPVFVTEAGNFDTRTISTPAEMVYFFNRLYDFDYVLGATPFIWDSGPEHDDNIWINNPSIAETTRRVVKTEVDVPSDGDILDGRRDTPPAKLGGWNPIGADLPSNGAYQYRPLSQIRAIVLHHFGLAFDSMDEASTRRRIEAVARWHTQHNKWPGIGYHYVIDQRGVVWWTGPANTLRWHAGNRLYNEISVGVAFPGDHRVQSLTLDQVAAAKWLVRRLHTITGNDLEVKLHWEVRDGATECPGEQVAVWRNDIERGQW